MPAKRSAEGDGLPCRMRIPKPSLRKSRLSIQTSPPFEQQVVRTSAFATLEEFRRSQMTVIPFEIPRRRLRPVPHPRKRGAARHVVGRVLATLREWRRRSHDRAELAGLDDRMLKDIGLTRCDAEFLGNQPFWRA